MIETRTKQVATNEKELYIQGKAIVFNEETEINTTTGSYTEIIKPGALDNTDFTDSRLLYNHNFEDIPLARVPNTMNYEISETGMYIKALLPDTEQGKSVYKAIERGDLQGMSFSFTIPEGGDSFDVETNTRTIYAIDKVYEVSIVPFPAYKTTSIEARSLKKRETKDFNLNKCRDHLKIKINQVLAKDIL